MINENPFDDKLKIYNLSRKVPEEAKKEIGAGRLKGMTDINPMWRVKKLTELFGACGIGWKYDVIRSENVICDNKEIIIFVDVHLFIKDNNEWSSPIFGTGGSKISVMENKGIYNNDEAKKMATTDALSVACKMLGIGADVYFSKDRSKYDLDEQKTTKPPLKDYQKVAKEYLESLVAKNMITLDKIKKIRLDNGIDNLPKLSEEEVERYITLIDLYLGENNENN